MAGKSEKTKSLYHAFIQEYKKIGKFDLHPAKTRVALVVKMRFASVNRLGSDFLAGHLILNEEARDVGCFYRIDKVSPSQFVHHFRMESPHDLTPELVYYMRMAYKVGTKENPGKPHRGTEPRGTY